jgi:hypothetical protein
MARRSPLVIALLGVGAIVVGCAKTPDPSSVPALTSKPGKETGASHREQPTTVSSKPIENSFTKTDDATKWAAPRIIPAMLALAPGDVGAQLIAEVRGTGGGRRDVTSQVAWSVEPAGIAAIEAGGYLRPLAPGEATIRASHEGGRGSATSVVKIEGTGPRAWDFAEDVVPILTRSGCNTGSCHGKAEGQNGFHL